ncbi:B2 protein isoform X2 [Magnolia sinica]|uniref:B2 protein isoform X2 n=1 Tax=Magnolia sinica TaxID=86752 RepID=UPI002659E739|nr:B2 protein isoform X2 [Magnolia sinica]
MENQQSFWQFSDQLRLQSTNFSNLSINDSIWATAKRPEERRNFDSRVGGKVSKQKGTDFNGFNDGWKISGSGVGGGQQKNVNGIFNKEISKKKKNNNNDDNDKSGSKGNGNNGNNSVDKRFKTLPPSEALPRNETVGGYIFVCNNDTMQENLRRQLFGLPPRYRDSVRAITPGLPLFLYNYSTHQLHGIFEAASFGGTNIDPTAWEDKKCIGESRFPAQVCLYTETRCMLVDSMLCFTQHQNMCTRLLNGPSPCCRKRVQHLTCV